MHDQAFPHDNQLIDKARRDAIIAASLGDLQDYSSKEIEYLSKQGYTFSKDTLNMAEDVKQLLSEHSDLLSRSIRSWHGWTVSHDLMFDDQFNTVINRSPEPIVTALLDKDLIHTDCKTTKYTPPNTISSLVQYLSKLHESILFYWFLILENRQIAAHSSFTFDEAIHLLRKDMQTLL